VSGHGYVGHRSVSGASTKSTIYQIILETLKLIAQNTPYCVTGRSHQVSVTPSLLKSKLCCLCHTYKHQSKQTNCESQRLVLQSSDS